MDLSYTKTNRFNAVCPHCNHITGGLTTEITAENECYSDRYYAVIEEIQVMCAGCGHTYVVHVREAEVIVTKITSELDKMAERPYLKGDMFVDKEQKIFLTLEKVEPVTNLGHIYTMSDGGKYVMNSIKLIDYLKDRGIDCEVIGRRITKL